MALTSRQIGRFHVGRAPLGTLLLAAGTCLLGPVTVASDGQEKDAALGRARREIKMLDDIYKSGIVTITQHYVNDQQTIPAGTAFKKLFEAVEKKGWHRVRLVDATGEPYSDENVPEDDFEKKAIQELVAGKPYVDTVEVREGVRHLRAVTAIPVVFDKCIMCHDNYAGVPAGKAIGALSYTVPIDGPLKPPSAAAE